MTPTSYSSSAAPHASSKTDSRYWRLRGYFVLAIALLKRDISARFRRTILGPLWALIAPVMTMVVFTFLRGVVEISSDGIPYPIFLFAAVVPWTFFAKGVTQSGQSVLNNSGIIRKMDIPRILFPILGVLESLFELAMASIVLVALMLWFRIEFTFALLWLPLLVFLTGLLALSIGFGLTAFGIYRRDFLNIAPHFIQAWFFVTPIAYPLSQVPDKWESLYMLNPTVGLIEAFRTVLILGEAPDLTLLGISAVITLLILVVTLPIYMYMSRYFADVL